jgi:hypothetical protein
MYCKFSNFICEVYLNIFFGKLNFSILFYLESFFRNVNLIKQKHYSESINVTILKFNYNYNDKKNKIIYIYIYNQ